MAYILDKTKISNYLDESGNLQENPYLVIDSVVINKFNENYKNKFPTNILVFVFKDQQARIDAKKPVEQKTYFVDDPSVYDSYFSMDQMATSCIFCQAYKYVGNFYPDWKSDEI